MLSFKFIFIQIATPSNTETGAVTHDVMHQIFNINL